MGRAPPWATPAFAVRTCHRLPGRDRPGGQHVRGYTLTGGRVTLQLTGNSAKLVSAVPDDGYSVQTWSAAGWVAV